MEAVPGSRKVEMLKRTQWFVLVGFVLGGLLALAKADTATIATLWGGFLLAVTGNYGAFVAGNVQEHKGKPGG